MEECLLSFQLKSVHELVEIAAEGGGYRLDGTLKSTEDLERIAAAAKSGGAIVTIHGLHIRSQIDLVRIAKAVAGLVVMED